MLTRVSLAIGVLISAALAQGSFVVPQKANQAAPGATAADEWNLRYPFLGSASSPTRIQFLYDVTEIPVATAALTAFAFRAPHDPYQFAATYQLTVDLSMGPRTSTTVSTYFPQNHGATVTQVFNGTVNLSSASSAVPWPAPWESTIVFSQPFPYDSAAGSSLVVDLQAQRLSGWLYDWVLEGYREEPAVADPVYYRRADCLNSSGAAALVGTISQLSPGATLRLGINNYPTGVPSLAANGLFFSPTGLGTPLGPFTSPVSLNLFGLPSPANCNWVVDIALQAIPMNYIDLGTSARLEVTGPTLPNSQAVVGAVIYAQNLALDTVGGAPSWYPSPAIKWIVGTGIKPGVGYVYKTGTMTYASAYKSRGVSMRFDY